ncbi:hypothetical protein SH1V18_43160 [Vallitalea longa]|uniref:B box-type domain-containing protein n=1 Tax=Vallitalea longa TaxID=2936439 RepID=A0A9W5YFQ3_9FIRM|nr:hypothetical protein [Vallitalea longa]GKX31836.1 hypothetical protein SH1V18_43160 [Vallitalea longa]
MKCFYHQDRDSQYKCKKCGKHLCSQCKVIAGNVVYCKECYESLKNNNINREYNKFWAFVLSLIPGVGHMYLGLMKKGLYFLLLIISCMFLADVSYQTPIVALLGIVIWFYSFFDAYHIRKRIDNNEDILNTDIVSNKILKINIKKKYIAYGLIIIGVYLLFNYLLLDINSCLELTYVQRRTISRIVVPIILIIGGLLLLKRIKKTVMNDEQELDDNRYITDEYDDFNKKNNGENYESENDSFKEQEVNIEDEILENEIDIDYNDEKDNLVN